MRAYPTTTSPVPDWQRERSHLNDAKLVFHLPFEEPYHALGHPMVNPAAEWATQAIETLRRNRSRFAHRRRPSTSNIREVGPIPPWIDLAINLEELSASSAPAWRHAIHAMIVEQLPDFHLHPDWKSVSSSKPMTHAQREIIEQIIAAVRV